MCGGGSTVIAIESEIWTRQICVGRYLMTEWV
jgi:hypothetical protein